MSGESTRRVALPDPPRRSVVELDRAEAMALLGGTSYGRVVFSLNALPAVRPINHLVDGDDIIIRTRLSSAVASQSRPTGVVVAYQADQIDPVRRLGWSVVVTGLASPVTDPDQISRYEAALIPWVDMVMDTVLRIRPQIVNGFRLVA